MPKPQPTPIEVLGKQGADFRSALIERMAQAYNGGKQADAVNMSHARELELYMLPTSPAAIQALKMGGTREEAEEANRLYAAYMKQQQEQLAAGGATAEQIAQAGLTDEDIFKACRKHAYELGKQNGHDDPDEEVKWHEVMSEKAAKARAERMTYQTVDPQMVGGD